MFEVQNSQPRAWALDVLSFATEEEYDILTVNGIKYSGAQGPFQGLVPMGTIEWSSDARQIFVCSRANRI